MSSILYKNQYQLTQKPIYDLIAFKEMLEIATVQNLYTQ